MKKIIPFFFLLAGCVKNNLTAPASAIPQTEAIVLPLNIICAGNSLTWGYRLPDPATESYPAQLQALLPLDTVLNKGVNGITTPQMQARLSTDVYPFYDSTKTNVVIAWEVGNDIYFNGVSYMTAYNNFVTYCDSVRAHGFKVVVINLPYRNNYYYSGNLITPGGDDTTQYSQKLLSVNTLLKQNWRTFADKFVKVPFSTYDTTDYIFDYIHLTQVGYQKIDSVILKNLPK